MPNYYFDQFFGVIIYADDIILLSSSLINLQCMIDTCIQFSDDMGVSFGYLKPYSMAYHLHKAGYIPSTMLSLGEFKLNWIKEITLLGNLIC